MSEYSSLPQLIPLGGETGAYCDPVTGECIPGDLQGNKPAFAVDPVCKMTVNPEAAQYKTEYEGQTYHFCASGCQSAFEKEPQKYQASAERQSHD